MDSWDAKYQNNNINNMDTVERAEIESQGCKAVITPARDADYPKSLRNGTINNNDKHNQSQRLTQELCYNNSHGVPALSHFSPLLLRRTETMSPGTSNNQDVEVDPHLVATERYDPQSKAFSYVPVHSLQEHFKAPRKPTKLIPLYDKLPAASSSLNDSSDYHNQLNYNVPRSTTFTPLDNELLNPEYYMQFTSNNTHKEPYSRQISSSVNDNGDYGTSTALNGSAPAVFSTTKQNDTKKDALASLYDTPFHIKNYQEPLHIQTPIMPCNYQDGSENSKSYHHCHHRHGNHHDLQQSDSLLTTVQKSRQIPSNQNHGLYYPPEYSSIAKKPAANSNKYYHPLPAYEESYNSSAAIDTQPTKLIYSNIDSKGTSLEPISIKQDWLERQMCKLKRRQIENDPDLKIRKEQEKMLLEELKHIHDEKNRSELDYCVEGYGTKSVEPENNNPMSSRPFDDNYRRKLDDQEMRLTREEIYSKIEPNRVQKSPPMMFYDRQYSDTATASMNTLRDVDTYQPFGSVQPSPKSILKKPRSVDIQVPTTSYQLSNIAQDASYGPAHDYDQRFYNYSDNYSSSFTGVDQMDTCQSTIPPPYNGNNRDQPRGLRATTPAFPLGMRSETPMPYHPLLYQKYSDAFRSQTTTPQPRAVEHYNAGRRPSLQYLEGSPMESFNQHPVFVKDTSKYWYKPKISRDEAINMLREKPPGTFVIRDSNSFPGAFGLAMKVASPPPGVQTRTNDGSELVRHFLIEPTAKGVKLKGCNNEPVFGSLASLVYQHSITPLALPAKLILPDCDPATSSSGFDQQMQNKAHALLEQGAACNVTYLLSCDVESLTGPEAVRRTVDQALILSQRNQLQVSTVHFKVASPGITLTDNSRKLFFRRHYPVVAVTFCGLDPDERRWNSAPPSNLASASNKMSPMTSGAGRIFGFVAKKCPAVAISANGRGAENTCHVFAEYEPEQPAAAVVNFVTKVMMASFRSSASSPPHYVQMISEKWGQ